MSDGPMTPREIAEERERLQSIARRRYRSKKPGWDYHEWADARDAAVSGLARLDRIEANQKRRADEEAAGMMRRTVVERKPEDERPLSFEEATGITLEELLRRHRIERGHGPG